MLVLHNLASLTRADASGGRSLKMRNKDVNVQKVNDVLLFKVLEFLWLGPSKESLF